MTAISVTKSAQQAAEELQEIQAQLASDDDLWFYPYYGSYGTTAQF